MGKEPTVYVVDDDDDVRQSIANLIESMGLSVKSYDGAEKFLTDLTDEPAGCLVTDVRMLGMSGVTLVNEVKKRDWILPIIVITAHADVRMAIDLVSAGAMTLLEKPYREQELWESITKALEVGRLRAQTRQTQKLIKQRLARLTDHEMAILQEIILGKANKNISANLNIPRRTLDLRRQSLMKKMECQTPVDLLRMLSIAGFSFDKPIAEQEN